MRRRWSRFLRMCSSSIPSLGLPPRCLFYYHPHSSRSPSPLLSQGYRASCFPPSRPLQPCLLSTWSTSPNSVHIPCRVLRLGDNSHHGPGVSATRNVSCKTRFHSACNDGVARKVQRISGRWAHRRSMHWHPVSNGRAWAGL